MRASPEIVEDKNEYKLFCEMIWALRSAKKKDGKSPFERHMGREPNTVKSLIVDELKSTKLSVSDPAEPRINLKEMPAEGSSEIWIRNRVKKGKLDGLFRKKSGVIGARSGHTLSFLPKRGKEMLLSKRDVAIKKARKQLVPKRREVKMQEREVVELMDVGSEDEIKRLEGVVAEPEKQLVKSEQKEVEKKVEESVAAA